MTTDRPIAGRTQYEETTVPLCLWAAAKANDVALMTRLIDEGSPIDEPDNRGYAPLMLAGYAGNVEAVELLLARGADPNTTDLFGNTVLMGAAYKGFVDIVRLLLAAGADLGAMNYGGLDARGFALTYRRDDVFAVLEQHAQRSAASHTAPAPAVPVPGVPPHVAVPCTVPPHTN